MLAGWIVMGSLTAIVSVLAGIVIAVQFIVIFVLLKRYLICGHTIICTHNHNTNMQWPGISVSLS